MPSAIIPFRFAKNIYMYKQAVQLTSRQTLLNSFGTTTCTFKLNLIAYCRPIFYNHFMGTWLRGFDSIDRIHDVVWANQQCIYKTLLVDLCIAFRVKRIIYDVTVLLSVDFNLLLKETKCTHSQVKVKLLPSKIKTQAGFYQFYPSKSWRNEE